MLIGGGFRDNIHEIIDSNLSVIFIVHKKYHVNFFL